MKIATEVVVSAAHFLPNYDGKCSNLHGHDWRIGVLIEGGAGPEGMVMDFSLIKGEIKRRLDHTFLNLTGFPPPEWVTDLEQFQLSVRYVLLELGIDPDKEGVLAVPTAENLAAYIGELTLGLLEQEGDAADDILIRVWESDVSYAEAFLGGDF